MVSFKRASTIKEEGDDVELDEDYVEADLTISDI